ncbi:MAG TPA: hypothetical protein VD967_02300 [Candidatus Paceibacterota bacterium]|nr:hypothetical protein [Candidatus Paceibacterota bacterium]
MRRYPLKLILAALVLLLLVIGEAHYLYARAEPSPPTRLQSKYFAKEKAEWGGKIDALGAKGAYAEFLRAYADLPLGSAHSLAHIFGELLYEKEGLSGVAVCDNSFGFGCYHSFFGRAISEHGVEVVRELDRACIAVWGEKGLGCQHGIGHGVLWYLGDEHLVDALSLCASLTWKGPIGGCSSGVFMEYNFRTMADPDGASVRPYEASLAHMPCSAISVYGEACYFEMPHWWIRIFEGSVPHVGALCREVSVAKEKEACFKGIGNILAAKMSYDVEETRRGCGSLGSQEEKTLCSTGASWSFMGEPRVRDKAPELCEGLPAAERSFCLEGSDII